MDSSVTNAAANGHRLSIETVQPQMAKAHLKKLEMEQFRQQIGKAIGRAIAAAGLSQKEVAGRIDCDAAQLARWIAATERPQFDRLFSVDVMRQPLCCELARLAGAHVVTRIDFGDGQWSGEERRRA